MSYRTSTSSGYGYKCPTELTEVLCRVIPGVNTPGTVCEYPTEHDLGNYDTNWKLDVMSGLVRRKCTYQVRFNTTIVILTGMRQHKTQTCLLLLSTLSVRCTRTCTRTYGTNIWDLVGSAIAYRSPPTCTVAFLEGVKQNPRTGVQAFPHLGTSNDPARECGSSHGRRRRGLAQIAPRWDLASGTQERPAPLSSPPVSSDAGRRETA